MNTKSFDFTDINAATKSLTAGMKLAVAQGLIKQAHKSLVFFENPLAEEAEEVLSSLVSFREKYKAAAIEKQP